MQCQKLNESKTSPHKIITNAGNEHTVHSKQVNLNNNNLDSYTIRTVAYVIERVR